MKFQNQHLKLLLPVKLKHTSILTSPLPHCSQGRTFLRSSLWEFCQIPGDFAAPPAGGEQCASVLMFISWVDRAHLLSPLSLSLHSAVESSVHDRCSVNTLHIVASGSPPRSLRMETVRCVVRKASALHHCLRSSQNSQLKALYLPFTGGKLRPPIMDNCYNSAFQLNVFHLNYLVFKSSFLI